jgi:hypothetical protein
VHIPFKGGGAEILRDLANGDIHVSWFNITSTGGFCARNSNLWDRE